MQPSARNSPALLRSLSATQSLGFFLTLGVQHKGFLKKQPNSGEQCKCRILILIKSERSEMVRYTYTSPLHISACAMPWCLTVAVSTRHPARVTMQTCVVNGRSPIANQEPAGADRRATDPPASHFHAFGNGP